MKKIALIFLVLLVGIVLGFNIATSQRVALLKSTLQDSITRFAISPSLNSIASKCEVPFYNFKEGSKKTSLIIGHAYGSSRNLNGLISPNLDKYLMENNLQFKEIIFTGDLIHTPSIKKWRALKDKMKSLDIKIKIAPGNHDIGTVNENPSRDIFFQEFDLSYPYIEKRDSLLMIYLDSSKNPGQIDEKIVRMLENSEPSENSVFIFSHHILRPQPHLIANGLTGHKLDINNIDVLAKAKKNFKKIYLISGDSGIKYMGVDCLNYQNIFFISSGISQSPKDRALILDEENLYQTDLLY